MTFNMTTSKIGFLNAPRFYSTLPCSFQLPLPIDMEADLSNNQMPSRSLPWALLVMFVVVTVVNFGSRWFPGGAEQFRNMPDTRIDAAGFAFPIIWSLIFFGMIGFAIDLIRHPHEWTGSLRSAIRWLLVAGAASIAFVPISLYASDTASWIDILVHLIALIAAQVCLRRHIGLIGAEHRRSRWLFLPPSLYLGWISAATAISTALMLRENRILVQPEVGEIVTLMVIACLTIVGALMVERKGSAFSLTLAWAFLAIGVEQADHPIIRKAAWGAAAVLVVMAATAFYLKRFFYANTHHANTHHANSDVQASPE